MSGQHATHLVVVCQKVAPNESIELPPWNSQLCQLTSLAAILSVLHSVGRASQRQGAGENTDSRAVAVRAHDRFDLLTKDRHSVG